MNEVHMRSEMGLQVMNQTPLYIKPPLRMEDMPPESHYYNLAKIKSQQSKVTSVPFWIIWLIVSILFGLLIK